ncbi:hypothetical protein AX15_003150 [Amanita polypyramis BW_CC]|nr:hypothetical protein AX15_003150 [Amanita polypyramis BW_CC]
MMLVQKQPNLPLSPTLAHRRNPSAPVVIVQPTRTPGLLSLSKPPRPSPPQQRQLHAHQRQHRAATKPRYSTAPVADKLAPATSQPADNSISEKKSPVPAAASSTTSPQQRGRAHLKHPKEKTNVNPQALIRSTSHNSLRGKPARQPSPTILPQIKTPQAEGPTATQMQSSDLSDPFLDNALLNKSPPILTAKPSGKLARRRQPHVGTSIDAVPSTPTPASSKAIPMPAATTRTHTHSLSRSDPTLSHMPPGAPRRRSSATGLTAFDAFPICDDMTDAGDLSDHERSPPVTPTRPKPQNRTNTSPRTAPISSTFHLLPSAPASAPQLKSRQGGRRHKRCPSEGVFNMSSDEDSSSGLNPRVMALFQSAKTPNPAKKTPALAYASPYMTLASVVPKLARDFSPGVAQAKEKQFEREAAEKVAGYFASSSFQNSPSPEELPDPLFI